MTRKCFHAAHHISWYRPDCLRRGAEEEEVWRFPIEQNDSEAHTDARFEADSGSENHTQGFVSGPKASPASTTKRNHKSPRRLPAESESANKNMGKRYKGGGVDKVRFDQITGRRFETQVVSRSVGARVCRVESDHGSRGMLGPTVATSCRNRWVK
jgi:hypothetical protein